MFSCRGGRRGHGGFEAGATASVRAQNPWCQVSKQEETLSRRSTPRRPTRCATSSSPWPGPQIRNMPLCTFEQTHRQRRPRSILKTTANQQTPGEQPIISFLRPLFPVFHRSDLPLRLSSIHQAPLQFRPTEYSAVMLLAADGRCGTFPYPISF